MIECPCHNKPDFIIQHRIIHTFGSMDYLLEVPKEKQAFIEELLRALPFVKTKKLSPEKAERMRDLIDAVAELKEIEAGKRKARSMKTLLREL